MLVGILVTYALVIIFGDSAIGDPLRILLLGLLLWLAMRLHGLRTFHGVTIAVTLLLTAAAVVAKQVGSPRVASGVVGAATLILITGMIAAIVSAILQIGEIDTSAVLGVLCVYLLLALFFAAINQLLGAFSTHYLNGTGQPASASDLLYFSVITLATVGYGDITPASAVARAVIVVEALTGQLYLVSVVAAVVSAWRRPSRPGP
jgi:hypothetical protein